ncbi:Uncharacterised protein [Candidatus Bilamarchaeum dharawalense]|uniref:Glycerophosphoryl diester phosphodiesterase membrane domain-containing protein n=1 Tax=Candidatus Bilamarchaeum dharawalense TaxID=2885759 RepID=A0A5E4LUW2_9ARCH|nr:Uncharacterised protein [Candidatus Bilamarchaeum dharawalense]
MGFDFIGNSFNESINLLKSDFSDIFKGFFIIQFLALVVLVLGFGLAIAPYFLLLPAGTSLGAGGVLGLGLIFIVVSIIVIILAVIFSKVIASSSYNLVDSKYKKEPFGMIGQIGANIVPYVFYFIVNLVITLIILGPFYAVYFFISTGSELAASDSSGAGLGMYMAGTLIGLVLRGIITIIASILGLFIQFAIFEVIVARKGVIESFKRSFDLVKANLLETVLFSFVLSLISSVIIFVVLVIVVIVAIIMAVVFGLGAAMLSASLGAAYGVLVLIVLAIAGVIALMILAALTALQDIIEIPAQYSYWKQISK